MTGDDARCSKCLKTEDSRNLNEQGICFDCEKELLIQELINSRNKKKCVSCNRYLENRQIKFLCQCEKEKEHKFCNECAIKENFRCPLIHKPKIIPIT